MQRFWKRTASLLLCGVLLVNNLPLAAMAEEEMLEEVLEEGGEVLQEADSGGMTQMMLLADPPPDTESEQESEQESDLTEQPEIVEYPVTVNGVPVTSANAGSILANGNISYDGKVTIFLAEDSENQIGTLYAGTDLVILGQGTLYVGEIEVDGNLTVDDAVVTVGTDKVDAETEQKTLVCVKNKITFMGASYFVTGNGHRAIVFTDTAAEHFVVAGAGYSRTAADGAFTELDPEMEMAANEPYFEFVSKKHLGDWVKTDKTHYKTCADEECVHYNNLKISEADHQTTANANCVSKAICDVCGEYGEKAPDVHDTRDPETKYLINEGTHQLVYSCCEMPYDGAEPAEHDADTIDCPEGSAVLKQMCSVCGYEHTNLQVSIAAPENLVWDGAPKEAVVTSGITRSALPPVKYYTYTDDIRSEEAMAEGEFPTAAGKYAAVQEVAIGERIYRPEVVFLNAQKEITESMVSLDVQSKTYDGLPKTLPTVTVTDGSNQLVKGTDYDLTYIRDGKTVANGSAELIDAGVIDVTVVGKGNYSGSINKTFTIAQADATAGLFKFTPPAESLAYDGKEKAGKITVKAGVVNPPTAMGEIEIRYYRKGETEQSQPVNVGEYQVNVYVKGTANYKEAEISDESWAFTITPAADYTDATIKEQTIGDGCNAFQWPQFTGAIREGAAEAVPGNVAYTYNGSSSSQDAIEKNLEGLQDGETAEIGYTFTPEADGNYDGQTVKTGTITVKKVKLTVKLGDNTYDNKETLGEKIRKNTNVTFGDTDIVDVSNLTVTVNGQTSQPGEGFTVKYEMVQSRSSLEAQDLLDRPNVGSAKFHVFFNGLGFDNIEVATGNIYVNPKDYNSLTITLPAAKDLTETAGAVKEPQELIIAGSDGLFDLEYSLTGAEGSYSTAIPEAAENGVYRVYYRSPGNGNYTQNVEGHVDVVIKPYLTATYGETLADVEERISCASGTWEFDDARDTVGDVTDSGNTFRMSFTPKPGSALTKTNCDVVIHVAPAHVELDVSLIKPRYHKYTGAEIKPSVSVKVLSDWAAEDKTFPATEYEKVYSSITHPGDTAVVRPGKARVTIESNGNYIFDNTEEELTEEYIIFRAGYVALADTAQAVPPELKTTYATGADMKQALGEKLGESFPESKRAYVKYLMMNENKSALYDEFYWPDGGYGTLSWDYIGDLSQEDTFVVYGMYLVTSNRLGTRAGEIFQMTETDDTTPGTNEFYVAEDGIKFRLKNYAALCFAAEVDPNAVYEIGTSAKNGTVAFSIGSDSTLFTAATAKAGEKITVKATPKTNYALTKVQYLYEEGDATKAVTVEQNFSGKYIFEMPDRDITIKATFARKTSDSKNPYSGDRSRIGLWTGILALSGAGIAALVVFWLRKRKK